uniref:Uncharacterized protein n=1 Tax=Candidozyma auris TaxID=498019 RepID=A0A0L0NP43_CANAR
MIGRDGNFLKLTETGSIIMKLLFLVEINRPQVEGLKCLALFGERWAASDSALHFLRSLKIAT